jgi:uncharacterized membrane protein
MLAFYEAGPSATEGARVFCSLCVSERQAVILALRALPKPEDFQELVYDLAHVANEHQLADGFMKPQGIVMRSSHFPPTSTDPNGPRYHPKMISW